jgi:hypothetical protein
MSSSYYFQTAISLFAGILICGAWWYAAIKFPRTWVFGALAIIATISILLYAGVLFLIESGGGRSGLVHSFSAMQAILHLTEAVLLILLVRSLAANAAKSGT